MPDEGLEVQLLLIIVCLPCLFCCLTFNNQRKLYSFHSRDNQLSL